MQDKCLNLAVVGGTSLVTPMLIVAVGDAVASNRLPSTNVRLWGRDRFRLQRIRDLSEYLLAKRRGARQSISEHDITVSIHHSLRHAVSGATHILCQVRPGGMEGRARDERLALNAGIPGDEGIGPSGLSAFLRGRQAVEDILRLCAEHAPSAAFLQMTSPLGLMTALADRYYPGRGYGVCELPTTVSALVRSYVEPRIGRGPLTFALGGLNHQSWLYAFQDLDGVDRTGEVVRAFDDNVLLGVDPSVIAEHQAVPMPYLRMYLHTDRELQRQQRAGKTRGEELTLWSQRVNSALIDLTESSAAHVMSLISFRKADWYEKGVVPVLESLTSPNATIVPLNARNGGALPGLPTSAIVEAFWLVGSGRVESRPAPPLPAKPEFLTRQLIEYEQAALALPATPTEHDLGSVLAHHPLVPSRTITSLVRALCTYQQGASLRLG